MRLISQFSRASGARFSETDDSPETVVGRWILPAKLKGLFLDLQHICRKWFQINTLWLNQNHPFLGSHPCPAAHNAVGLAGESPAVGIDCLST